MLSSRSFDTVLEGGAAHQATGCSGEVIPKALSFKWATAKVLCCGHKGRIAAERGARLGRVERVIITACTRSGPDKEPVLHPHRTVPCASWVSDIPLPGCLTGWRFLGLWWQGDETH